MITERSRRVSMRRNFIRSKYLLLMALPALIWYALFCYYPMYGVQIAFRSYNFRLGILGSEWVGTRYFEQIFKYNDFWNAVRNTVTISLAKLAFCFPLPVILAILLNELNSTKYRRVLQTVFTFPHFISWVIVYTLFYSILSGEGIINLIRTLQGKPSIGYFSDPGIFFGVLIVTEAWKTMGWSSIIYCAAISNINPEIMEAAVVDGANRAQRIFYITLPELSVTIVTLLILQIGNAMNAGFDQIFNFYNPLVYSSSDIIDTYVYRMAFNSSSGFSMSASVGLFKSVINFALLFGADRVAKAFHQPGIY